MDPHLSVVESKLLYSLSSMCLTVSEKRQLNGVQNRRLRQIVGIKPSFSSRVSNLQVLQRSGHTLATTLLDRRQLQLFGKVLRSPETHPLRAISFIPGTNRPLTERFVRRRGRPALEWIPQMIGKAVAVFGNMAAVEQAASNKLAWETRSKDLISFAERFNC